jgi:hypothetical protein
MGVMRVGGARRLHTQLSHARDGTVRVGVVCIWTRSVPVHGEGPFADVHRIGCDISDYVRGAAFEPKVFLSQEVSANYADPCGEDSVISSVVHEEVLTAVSWGTSRASAWSLPRE